MACQPAALREESEPALNKATKVCIVSTHFAPETTGNAPYATSLARGLAARGYEVTVLCGAPHYPGWVIRPATEWRPVEREHMLSVGAGRKLNDFAGEK